GGGLPPSNGRQWARLGILHRARHRRRVARQRDRRNETHPGLCPLGTSQLYLPRPTAAPQPLKGAAALPRCGFPGADPALPRPLAGNPKASGGGEPPPRKRCADALPASAIGSYRKTESATGAIPENPSCWAAAGVTSMTRPCTKGP